MTLLEKRLTIVFSILFFVLLGLKIDRVYLDKTQPVPGFGGKYKEAIYGDLKYLNPILASSDVDRGTSKLIFSSLIRASKNGEIIPDVASSWTVSSDGLKYTFTLKDNVYFSDGGKLTANDVAYTIGQIQNPDLKSPLFDKWKDVEVTIDSENSITFTLSKAYGPFIYNCDFGIIPGSIDPDTFSHEFIGSGPYKFVETTTVPDKVGTRISKLTLTSYSNYYNGSPYIKDIELDFYNQKDLALKNFQKGKVDALAGVETTTDDDTFDMSIETNKHLALILNLRKEILKDKETRNKIINGQNVEGGLNLTLTTLDGDVQRQKAEEIKNNLAKDNITINIRYLKAVDFTSALNQKDFELLLYGFDFGHDRDPYPFWHSTQLNKNNFAGYSNKDSDILLEDARMLTDPVQRNQKYDQFMQTVANENLAHYYDPIVYPYYIDNRIKGVPENISNDVSMKYFGIEKWYIKEDRVKK